MQQHPTTLPNRWLALVIGLTFIALFGYVLFAAIWQDSTAMINSVDSFIYLRTGMHLTWGDGLGIPHYYPDTDSRQFVPTTHYPPLTSLTYSILVFLFHLPPDMLPVIVSLVGWIALLAGIGVFTYQLGKSPLIAAMTIILPATSYGIWFAFLHAMSEPIFLPLLVWLMVLTYNLPQRQQGQRIHLVGVSLVLMLLMLTRYSGVVALAAVMLWWAWHWWYTPNRKLSRLIGDSAILAASALPLVGFIGYHKLQATAALGGHVSQSTTTFWDGIWAFVIHSGQILLPNSTLVIVHMGWYGWLVYLPLLIVFGWLVWYVARKTPSWLKPHPTPALLFLVGYVSLYTIVQPFFSFEPINWRDMTSILCLTIPLMYGAIGYLPGRWSYMLLVAYIGLNSGFSIASGMVTHPKSPTYLHNQQAVSRPITEQQEQEVVESSSIQEQPRETLPQSGNFADQNTALVQWVQTQSEEQIIITNTPELLAMYARGTIEHITAPYSFNTTHKPAAWLDVGACNSQYPVSIVLFQWDKYAMEAQTIQQTVERKCPGLPKRQFEHSVVYTLHQEKESDEQS